MRSYRYVTKLSYWYDSYSLDSKTMDLILTLPTVLSCHILGSWLQIKSFVRTDSAYCTRNKRPRFHALFPLPELLASIEKCPRQNIGWFLKRNVQLKDFVACREIETDAGIRYLENHGRYISSVIIPQSVDRRLIQAVWQYCSNATELSVHQLDGDRCDVQHFPNLRRLTYNGIRSVIIAQYASLRSHLPYLKYLCIQCHEDMRADSMRAICDMCPYVTHLDILGAFAISGVETVSILGRLPKLRAVRCHGFLLDDFLLGVLVRVCPNIVHLDLYGHNDITDAGIEKVTTGLKLQSLRLSNSTRLTDVSLVHLRRCAATLTVLSIDQMVGYGSGVTNMTLLALQQLQHECTRLRVEWNSQLVGDGFSQLVRLCTNATTLTIGVTVTDAKLSKVPLYCKLLRHLDLSSLTSDPSYIRFTSAGLRAVIDNCPQLQSIFLSDKMNKTPFRDIITAHPTLFKEYTISNVFVFNILLMP